MHALFLFKYTACVYRVVYVKAYSLKSFGFQSLHDVMLKYCVLCLSQGLFYRVVGGEVSPFRLVRLSAEELLSKEISEWRKSDAPEVNATSPFN